MLEWWISYYWGGALEVWSPVTLVGGFWSELTGPDVTNHTHTHTHTHGANSKKWSTEHCGPARALNNNFKVVLIGDES